MSLFKLICHDLRCGLLRKRYITVPLIFAIPCLLLSSTLRSVEYTGTWVDYALYCFKGIEPIDLSYTIVQIQLPVIWLLVICGCLIINLDYFLNDLSQTGLQVLYRCDSRQHWFLSKCIWNIFSCALYFVLAGLTMFVFLLFTDSNLQFMNTPEITMSIFGLAEPVELNISQCILLVIVLPYLTMSALCILQMVLCLFVKPVLSFLICVSILVISVYLDSSLILGNGAMAIRSNLLVPNGLDWHIGAFLAVCIIIFCVIFGIWKFTRVDILIHDD